MPNEANWKPYFALWPVRITHGPDGQFLPPVEAIKQPWAWLCWVEQRSFGAWWFPGPVYRLNLKHGATSK